MKFFKSLAIILSISCFAISCSKKISPTQPGSTSATENKVLEEKIDAKPDTSAYVVKRKVIKTTVPKVITVNDVAAKKNSRWSTLL